MVVFALNGLLLASWMSRLPDIREMLHLSSGQLSLLILSISIGAICGLPASGTIASHLGAIGSIRLGLALALPGIVIAAIGVTLGWPIPAIMPALFVVGLGNAVWDVAQNLEGTYVEQAASRAIMPWFHAAFSGGTVLGALIGAALVAIQFPIAAHLGIAAGITALGLLVSIRNFVPEPQHDITASGSTVTSTLTSTSELSPPKYRSAWTEPRTLLIGVMVLAAAFAEGSANDWMAIAFVTGHGTDKTLGVIATAVFLTFMTAGRIFGTKLLDRFGRVIVLRTLFACAVIGILLVVFGSPLLAFVGAAVWGLGASLGFPVGMSAAADDPARGAARISVVSTIGYGAFLGGPPLLGFLGDHIGVLHSLLVVGVVSVLALLIVPVARPLSAEPPESQSEA